MLYTIYTMLEATIYLFDMLDVDDEFNLTNIIIYYHYNRIYCHLFIKKSVQYSMRLLLRFYLINIHVHYTPNQ